MKKQPPASFDLKRLADTFREGFRSLATKPAASSRAASPFDRIREAAEEAVRQAQILQQEGRVKRREQLVQRAAAVVQPLERERQELKERVEQKHEEPPPSKSEFVVAGRVLDAETGAGLPGLRVRVLERDRTGDDFLGEVLTDTLGYYRKEYDRKDFDNLFERSPEVYIQVLDARGGVLYTSDQSFRHKAGKLEIIHAAVDGGKVPESRDQGRRNLREAKAGIETLEARTKTIDSRAALRLSGPVESDKPKRTRRGSA